MSSPMLEVIHQISEEVEFFLQGLLVGGFHRQHSGT